MTLIPASLLTQLLANGAAQRSAIDNGTDALDFHPVVKLFTPDAHATWLLTDKIGTADLEPPLGGPEGRGHD